MQRNTRVCAWVMVLALCATPVFATAELGPQPENRVQTGVLSLREWSAEDLQRLQGDLEQRAKQDANLTDGYGLPAEGDIQLAQALVLADRAVHDAKGVSAEMLAQFSVLPFFMKGSELYVAGYPEWKSLNGYWLIHYEMLPEYYDTVEDPGFALYSAYLNPQTGEVLLVTDQNDGNG